MLALDLLNATDRFLGEARAISAERRKAQLELALQQEVAALFLRQGDMFLRKFAKLREVWPVQEAATFAPPYTPPSWEAFWRDVSDGTKDAFENMLDNAIRASMVIGGESLANNLALGASFDLRHPYAERYLWEHGAVNVTNINKTTEDYIRTVVAQGAEEGWSYDRVARAITDRFAEFAVGRPQQHIDSRAHLVAVTEVGMAYEAGNRTVANSLSEMGLQMEKSWLTAGDNRVCSDECERNQNAAPENSGWIPIDEPFPSGHQQPLAHPACRCAALYRRRPGGRVTEQPPAPVAMQREVTDDYPIGAGEYSARMVEFSDGSRGVWKAAESSDKMVSGEGEVSASIISNRLGFNCVPNTEFMELHGERGTIQRFVPNAKSFAELGPGGRTAAVRTEAIKQQMGRITVMDYINPNGDRHWGNWLIDADEKVWAIDNGIVGGNYATSSFLENYTRGIKWDKYCKIDKPTLDQWKAISKPEFLSWYSSKGIEKVARLNIEDIWDNFQEVIAAGGLP